MPQLTIDGIDVTAADGATVMEAAAEVGIEIPALCHVDGVRPLTSCMLCVVEDTRTGKTLLSCSTRAEEGMVILTNSDACADVVQSALMKAWTKRDTIKDNAQFKDWMVQIVQNESKNLLRRKPNLPLDESLASAESDQDHVDVKEAVARLPENARLIVMLYYFERYPVKDICLLLNLPEGTVHSRLARAREPRGDDRRQRVHHELLPAHRLQGDCRAARWRWC